MPLSLALTDTRKIKKVLPSSTLPNGILKAYKNKSDRNTLSDFTLSKNRLLKQYNEMYRQHRLKHFPYRQGINIFVNVSVQLL